MKRIISAFALTIVLAFPAAAQAAEEEQDWYTWYEQQSAQAAAEEAQQYEQYYEAASPDQQIASDAYTDPNGYYNPDDQNDPYAYDEAPEQTQEQTTPGAEAPEWVWSGEEPPEGGQFQEDAPQGQSEQEQSE